MVTLVILEQNMPLTVANNNLQNMVPIKTSEPQGKNMKRNTNVHVCQRFFAAFTQARTGQLATKDGRK